MDTLINHIEKAKNRLITQYQNTKNINDIIEIYCNAFQELEYVFLELKNKRLINFSKSSSSKDSDIKIEGRSLDLIGEIINEPRDDARISDEEYIIRLVAKIAENNSEGTIPDLINIFSLLMRAECIEYHEIPPANIAITGVNISPLGHMEYIRKSLNTAKAAGIKIMYLAKADHGAFSFAQTTDPNAEGFGDFKKNDVGGKFAEII
jgi:hypothetical protein